MDEAGQLQRVAYEEHWRVVGDTDGIVSVGVDPSFGMRDADMLIAWVKDGSLSIFYCYDTEASGPHPKDTDLGGQDDILESAGQPIRRCDNGEVHAPTRWSDDYDKEIATNSPTTLIWAYSGSDSFTAQHSSRGSATLEI